MCFEITSILVHLMLDRAGLFTSTESAEREDDLAW